MTETSWSADELAATHNAWCRMRLSAILLQKAWIWGAMTEAQAADLVRSIRHALEHVDNGMVITA